MGNTHTDVTNNVKAQADAQDNISYKLVDVKNGGELVGLVRDPDLRKQPILLEDEIRERIISCLYDEGRGEEIPMHRIVSSRSGIVKSEEKNKKEQPAISVINLDKLSSGNRSPSLTKKTCWDIDKRGAVGETPLHLCFLCGSFYHRDLAKRLIKLFPEMINDIYLSDEYYGENALHMAIVNEDSNMVKYLLHYKVDMHQRCCGKFFCPDDQKNSRIDSLTQEYPLVSAKTNYEGRFYFGEYPLSFAGVIGQLDCVKLLLANGADPNRQDSNGNTVLHMLVIHNKLEMFEYLLDNGARLDIKNRQNFTPLTLAAKLARAEIFKFILKKVNKVYWIYANVSCAAYPLVGLDTISEDGTTDVNSVLYSIVNSESLEHLKILDGLVLNLLQEKWNRFIRRRFYFELLFFLIFVLLTYSAIYLKRVYFDYLKEHTGVYSSTVVASNVHRRAVLPVATGISSTTEHATASSSSLQCVNISLEMTAIIDTTETCKCLYLYSIDSWYILRYINEFLVLIMAITVFALLIKEICIEKHNLYFKIIKDSPTKFLYLISCFFILLIIPFRLSCDHSTEDILSILALILMFPHFMYYSRGFRALGPYVLMIKKIIGADLSRFGLIYLVFLIGFSQALYIACDFGIKDDKIRIYDSPFQSLLDMFFLTLGEMKDIYEKLNSAKYSDLGQILIFVYVLLVAILLLNLLIATMGNTFAVVSETKDEWLRQWAKVVLALEQSVFHQDRLNFQKLYSHTLQDGTRSLIVRWKQSEPERAELINTRNSFRRYAPNIPNMISN